MSTALPVMRAMMLGFALVILLFAPAEPARAQVPALSQTDGEASPGEPSADARDDASQVPMDDDNMVAPPVVDPKSVDTRSVAPAGDPLQRPDGFGDAETMQPVPVLMKAAKGSWDDGFQNIVATLKEVDAEMARLKLTPTGAPLVVYTATDDSGFAFDVQMPFTGATTEKPLNGVEFSASPAGKALRFTHRGPYDAMDPTYEQIANLLDAKGLEAQELYVEEYRSDPRTTAPDDLVIDIWVPLL